jgi:ribosome-binding factor A
MGKGRGSAPSQRQLRVGEELRHVVAAIIARGNIRDPELENQSITVTEVRVSPDLRNATVIVVPLGGADMDRVVAALQRAAPYLRREVAREVTLRNTPALTFAPDLSFDEAARIDDLLRRPAVARDLENRTEDDGT